MTRLKRSWRTWRALTWAQRWLFVRAWLLLPVAVIGVRLFGFQRTQAALLSSGHEAGRINLPAAHDAARILDSAVRWSPFSANCLVRSLALCGLLRGENLAAELRIGVARPGGQLLAHAWVEHGGVVLNDREDVGTRYAAFETTWPARYRSELWRAERGVVEES